jgi:hypothetical protein
LSLVALRPTPARPFGAKLAATDRQGRGQRRVRRRESVL